MTDSSVPATETRSTPEGSSPGGGKPSGPGPGQRRYGGLRGFIAKYGTLIGFGVMIILFGVLIPHAFPTWNNARNILEIAAPILIVAVGFTVVVAAEEYDLTFTGTTLISAVLAAKAVSEWGLGPWGAVVLAVGAGIVSGAITGVLVATKLANSLIVTIAVGTVWTGIALGLSKEGQNIMIGDEGYLDLTFQRPLGIPLPVIYSVVIVLIALVLLRKTVFGRAVRSIGSNEEAARLAGIGIRGTRILTFVFAGACYGVAAVILTSRAGQFSPDLSAGLMVPTFVAVFFGLGVLGARKVNVIGTVVGALFIGTLETGLVMLRTEAWVSEVVTGAALVVVLFAAAGKRRNA